MNLVVKGAYYYDRESETILVPHYTGDFFCVDCTEYEKIDSLKDKYDDCWIKENKDNFIEYEGEKYYYTKYSPNNVEDWELLSDLSELEHCEVIYDF